jgi:hypothetical protein
LPKRTILHCAEYVEFVNRAVCRQGFEGLIAAISDAKSRADFVQVRASRALLSGRADAGDFFRAVTAARATKSSGLSPMPHDLRLTIQGSRHSRTR